MTNVALACGCTANAKRKKGDDWIPCCAVHGVTFQVESPDLSNRLARCCTEKSVKPSSAGLAFFEYCGEGSRAATTSCKNCGYAKIAHDKKRISCDNFEPCGAFEYDRYYCGHSGWD